MGACDVDDFSLWDVRISRATLPSLDSAGLAWDVSGGLPDPFAEVEAESGGGAVGGSTDWIGDTVNPSWDTVVLTDVRADDLERGIRITVEDFDTFSGSDTMLICTFTPVSDDFRLGVAFVDCPASSAPVTTVAGQVVVFLEPS